MHFTSILASLLLSTSFVTASAMYMPPVITDPVIEGPFGIKATAKTWLAWSQLCGGTNPSKRDLETRGGSPFPGASVPVGMGKKGKFIGAPIGLWTSGLVTCIGLIVTGTTEDDESGRFLAHLSASRATSEDEYNAFATDVTSAQLKDSTGYISAPNLSDKLPEIWEPALADLAKEVEDAVTDKMKGLVKTLKPTTYRYMQPVLDNQDDPQGHMAVSDKNEVRIAGNSV